MNLNTLEILKPLLGKSEVSILVTYGDFCERTLENSNLKLKLQFKIHKYSQYIHQSIGN
jgi:hypothetical protein